MNQPLVVTIPHTLGRAEARQRIAGSVDTLQHHIPGGADVTPRWDGDRLTLEIKAMGQAVTGTIDVQEQLVRLEVKLPPALAMFGKQIGGFLTRKGGEMLEDGSK